MKQLQKWFVKPGLKIPNVDTTVGNGVKVIPDDWSLYDIKYIFEDYVNCNKKNQSFWLIQIMQKIIIVVNMIQKNFLHQY